MNVDSALAAGLDALNIELEPGARRKLLDFLELLARWNRTYNLTAIDRPEAMVARHLLDSLAVLPWIEGPVVLDAGTGAGLPGVPLAIARPDLYFRLVDSNGKRIRFLRQVKRSLKLDNVHPEQCRLEALRPEPAPDDIIARALAPLPKMVAWLRPMLGVGARLLAMKGRVEEEEFAGLGEFHTETVMLNVPGESGVRCLVIIRQP